MNTDNLSRWQATRLLSFEFIITAAVQTIVFLVLGGIAWGRLQAEIVDMRDDQKVAEVRAVDPVRMARVEEQLAAIAKAQSDQRDTLKEQSADIRALTEAVIELKTEVRRAR